MRVYALEIVRDQRGITIDKKYWKLELTMRQARRLDNGALISCGLTFGTGKYPASPNELGKYALAGIKAKSEVGYEAYQHSGCQSRCTLRGDDKCQW